MEVTMYCAFCGKKNGDGAKFCENCGVALVVPTDDGASRVTDASPDKCGEDATQGGENGDRPINDGASEVEPHASSTESVSNQNGTAVDLAREEEKDKRSATLLILGILSIAILESTAVLGIVSIILGAVGLSKAGRFEKDFGMLNGKAKAGKIMSLIGLIIGCILTPIFLYIGIGNIIQFMNGNYPWTEFIEIFGSM